MLRLKLCCLAAAFSAAGCATTVHRLDGDLETPVGRSQNACESERWLIVGRTRTEFVPEGSKLSRRRDDGIGFYRAGGREPLAIPELSDELEDPELVAPHREGVRAHDRDRVVGASLGAAGLVAIGIGTVLFINAFETSKDKNGDEQHEVNSTRAGLGGGLVGLGFALGISGIVVAPDARERAEADSWRYAFLPGRDDLDRAKKTADGHNGRMRQRCQAGAPASAEP